jgi:hypothetical protein
MAGCSVCTKAIEQMLIEGTALKTGHGKRELAVPWALTGCELRKRDGGQTRMKVTGELGL